MATQKIMFYTKDNRIIVADIDLTGYDDKRKRLELERLQHYFLHYDYSEINDNLRNISHKPEAERKLLSQIDVGNTVFVSDYVSGFRYVKNRAAYRNYVKPDNIPSAVKGSGIMNSDYDIDDSMVPEFVKNLGFNILPHDSLEMINVDAPNFDDEIKKQKTLMQVNTENREIYIYRRHYAFPSADYVRLRRLITDYNSRSPRPDLDDYSDSIVDSRDRKLFSVYVKESQKSQGKETFLHHEFHHIKNRMIFSGVMCKADVKRLTPEDTYRLEVENERSAYLSQTVECINRYLKGGNFDDYSMFDNFTNDLPSKLCLMTDSQKLAYLTNMDNVVSYALKRFEDNKRAFYDEKQFKGTTETSLLSQPMDVPEDLSGAQYRLMRSAFYSISVYNPTTGRNEVRNLSKFIKPKDEVHITDDEWENIVKPAKDELDKKLEKFSKDSAVSGINPNLLDEARAMMRKSMRTPQIISDAQTINVADLVDGKPLIDEHTSHKSPTPVPDDKAGWSDDLQKYWSKIEGYKEHAKNNFEYSFAIKNQDVRYTSKDNVSLGKNCGYEMYEHLVNEPSSAGKAIRFQNTLSREQALMLYVACINNGRRMRGDIPRDLSLIDSMTSIPKSARDKFKALTTPPAGKPTISPSPVTRPRITVR